MQSNKEKTLISFCRNKKKQNKKINQSKCKNIMINLPQPKDQDWYRLRRNLQGKKTGSKQKNKAKKGN